MQLYTTFNSVVGACTVVVGKEGEGERGVEDENEGKKAEAEAEAEKTAWVRLEGT
jgi:hypothetical protein